MKQDYVQQYDTQAEARIATLSVENKGLKQEVARLESLEEEYRAVNHELHESREEKSSLQTQIENLKDELRKERTKIAALKATVNTYIETAEARVYGSVLNIRPDMRNELENFKRNIENGRGAI